MSQLACVCLLAVGAIGLIATVCYIWYVVENPHDNNSKCECAHHSCGCCVHLEADIIELNSTLCTQVTYLSKSYGISFILDLNDKVIVNETATVEELSHKCYNVPETKRVVQICVGFYKVQESNNQLSCCLEAILNVKNDRIARAVFGCFKVPAKFTGDDSISILRYLKERYVAGYLTSMQTYE
ncbi:uncharacterized protein LOC135946433 isoform X1 [Cloeon dipterum]|uniref:uncharacterized protein LOC135946433 isoform X1 n=1 Tax=Cloeon dipterum TaxID=197152 RepID=UPI0032200955